MIYLLIAGGVLGVVTVLLSRHRVEPEPICPTCKQRLEDFSVERCPHCLLWQPPDRGRPTHRWQIDRLLLGLALILLPTFAWLLVSILLDPDLRRPSTPGTAAVPTFPALPPQAARMQRQIQVLGYASKATSPARAGATPTTAPAMSEEEAGFYQSLGFPVTTSAPASPTSRNTDADAPPGE
ncbi:MAG: hypothetical protein ABII12_04585 [Planctomycetota bacterium]